MLSRIDSQNTIDRGGRRRSWRPAQVSARTIRSTAGRCALSIVVEAVVDQLPIPVEELALHVDGLASRACHATSVQEAHQREVTA